MKGAVSKQLLAWINYFSKADVTSKVPDIVPKLEVLQMKMMKGSFRKLVMKGVVSKQLETG